MPRPLRIVFAMLLVVGACDGLPETTPTSVGSTSTVATTARPTSTSTTAAQPVVGCEGDPEEFTADGAVGIVGGPGADGQQISSVTLAVIGECERLEIAVSTDGGAPATSLPLAEVELIAGSGVLRVRFDASVSTSAITDSLLEGSLVRRAYVVRALDGAVFVDAHLTRAVAARALVRANPARVAVELQPVDGPTPEFPKEAGLVVVTGPTAQVLEYPITVTGYARTFEATVIARLFAEASTVTEVFTSTADPLEMWGEFALEIEDGPGGDVTIWVGEDSPVDGQPIGIEFVVSAG